MITHLLVDRVEAVAVGPGCYRRDLPTIGNVRAWIVDMEPGAEWPHVDPHGEHGEELLVVSGELIEGEQRYPEGSYLLYHPQSSHRPRTDTGVRLFGFNLL
jgi:anti-sigma factor ChrR (cupin superfamily)